MALGHASVLGTPCTMWRLGCLPGLGTLQRTHGAWDSLAVTHASAPL